VPPPVNPKKNCTRVVVYTPTQRPGMDVTHHSLRRQKLDENVEMIWVFHDELYDDRWDVFRNMTSQDNFRCKHIYIPKDEGRVRNLAKGYNVAIDIARDEDADMLISLQDYIWIPPDGVQQFVDMFWEIEVDGNTAALFTGITSISSDPEPEKVYDKRGLYTIFRESYPFKPQHIEWMDVRFRVDAHPYHETNPVEWETNWACIPESALYDDRLRFDEEYDKAVAYENQDFAFQAQRLGYKIIMDMHNQAISLPHKKYFSDEWDREQPLTDVNRQRNEGKWHG
jgi:hypothetical protein